MKKILIIIILVGGLFLMVNSTLAVDLGTGMVKKAATTAGYGAATDTTFASNIGLLIKSALSFVGVIFLALMVYAGYLWMTARGEDEQIKKSQNIIKSSLIGFIITVGAYSITAFVVPALLGGSTGYEEEDEILCCIVCTVEEADECVGSVAKKVLDSVECKNYFDTVSGAKSYSTETMSTESCLNP